MRPAPAIAPTVASKTGPLNRQSKLSKNRRRRCCLLPFRITATSHPVRTSTTSNTLLCPTVPREPEANVMRKRRTPVKERKSSQANSDGERKMSCRFRNIVGFCFTCHAMPCPCHLPCSVSLRRAVASKGVPGLRKVCAGDVWKWKVWFFSLFPLLCSWEGA